MRQSETEVVIVGGGIAGLTCAHELTSKGRQCRILEASERVGGRLKTDNRDGYLLDRGFQVLQTAYPAAQQLLDYARLSLQSFAPGTRIRIGSTFHTVADPLRRPAEILKTLSAPIGSMSDRLRLVKLARKVMKSSLEDLFREPETTTMDFLRHYGFSDRMIDRFFVPFFGGACLERKLDTSHHVFLYVLKMFAGGNAALPLHGMEQIPRQIASMLPPETVRTNSRVKRIEDDRVMLQDGTVCSAQAIVLATEGPETARLLDRPYTRSSVGETCFYFAAEKKPWHSAYLLLNGNGDGPINNIAIPSMVSPAYAPQGQSLFSVVVLENTTTEEKTLLGEVEKQLRQWFGPETAEWQHLATYRILHALPTQKPPTADPHQAVTQVEKGRFVCGEFGSLPAIQWALFSGVQAGKAVDRFLSEATREQ